MVGTFLYILLDEYLQQGLEQCIKKDVQGLTQEIVIFQVIFLFDSIC